MDLTLKVKFFFIGSSILVFGRWIDLMHQIGMRNKTYGINNLIASMVNLIVGNMQLLPNAMLI